MRLGRVCPVLVTQKGALLKAFHAARRRVVLYLDTLLEPQLSERDQGSRPGHFMGVSPDTRRSLAVAPLIPDQRCYGEAPGRLRCGSQDGLVQVWRNRRPEARLFSSMICRGHTAD